MTCKECAWCWKSENDQYPCCHYEGEDNEAPCEYEEPYEPEDYYDENNEEDLCYIRACILRDMDNEIRECGDEEIILYWLVDGVPDHFKVDLEYYYDFVDDECYDDIVSCYEECKKMMEEENDEEF